jgi:hypothetical protein
LSLELSEINKGTWILLNSWIEFNAAARAQAIHLHQGQQRCVDLGVETLKDP